MFKASENQRPLSRHFAIFVGLFGLALLIRLPELYDSPGFFEGNELKVTLDIVRGVHFPLFNQNPHIGAFSNYLMAAFFELLGIHWWVPRAVAVMLGALTIPLTYFIGCEFNDERTSILGAVLMAFSMYHVLVLSHIPWSNNMSPFFAALCIICLLHAIKDFKLSWLAATGFLFGLTLQTHPSMITILLPIVLIYLFAGKTPLRRRLGGLSPIVIVAASVVGYANMIYYNIANRLQSVSFAMTYPSYAVEKNPAAGTYFKNLSEEIFLLLRLLSGAAETKNILPLNWLTVALVLAGILLIAGLVECLRNREWQLPVLLFLPLLAIPIFNKAYEFCQFGRYLGFLLIPAYLLMARVLVRWFDQLQPKNLYVSYSLVLLLPVILIATNLEQLRKFSIELEFKYSSMIVFREIADSMREKAEKNTPLLVDRAAMKAPALMQFLQTDGWDVESLAGTFWTANKRKLAEDEARTEIRKQIARAETKTDKVIVISSPDFLPVLLEEELVAKCVGCLAVQLKEAKYESDAAPLYFFMSLSKDPTNVLHDPSALVLTPLKDRHNIREIELRVDKAALFWKKSCRKAVLEHSSITTEICKIDDDSKQMIRTRHRRFKHKYQKSSQ